MISETKITSKKKEADVGYVVQAIGPIVDVRFRSGLMPSLKTLRFKNMLRIFLILLQKIEKK